VLVDKTVLAPELEPTLTRPVALAEPVIDWVVWTSRFETIDEPVKVFPVATAVSVVESETSTTFSDWSTTMLASCAWLLVAVDWGLIAAAG
jgi:hypothetical protein